MRQFFVRNDPKTIKDAQELTKEEFFLKYKGLTSDEIINKAYGEIRQKHPPAKVEPPKQKSVTFKVIPTHIKADIGEDEVRKKATFLNPPMSMNEVIQDMQENGFNLTEGELPEGITVDPAAPGNDISVEASYRNGKIESFSVVSKSNRGRKPSEDKEKRDARIKELLQFKPKLSGKEILAMMKDEGFTVHAPQITAIKAIMKEDKI